MKNKIKQLAASFFPDTQAIRRHLHMYPELSFEEVQTGRFIAEQLKEWDIPHTHGVAENGVVGLIEGKNAHKKTTALRADFDALPIQEANDVSYKSKHEGVMHACGHDVHTASLLGAARILQQLKDEFEGTVKLIFQPGEEKLPGGASIMIQEGVLEDPKPATILGQHVHPPLEAGSIGLKPGFYMASADEIYLTVKGEGGHGALPHNCIDPIVITSQILTAAQQIVSRHANPTKPSVLTFGFIQSDGGATNIIPNSVHVKGTFRTFDEEWRFDAHHKLRQLVQGIAEGLGGTAELDIRVGYPALYNEERLTQQVKTLASAYLGDDKVVDLPLRMSAEDFAYFSQQMPACFYRLGTGNVSRGITSPIHTNTFDVDEDCLVTGSGLMAWLAINQLAA